MPVAFLDISNGALLIEVNCIGITDGAYENAHQHYVNLQLKPCYK
jgi:hypothetical protein